MDLTPQTLREVEFREKLRGYHPDDVDDFLEKVAVAVGELLDRLAAAEGGRAAPASVAGTPAREDVTSTAPNETLRRTLVLAQRTADLAISEAEETARQLLAKAEEDAARVRDEADAHAQAMVGDLETKRAGLEREVASLHAWVSQHRDRIRAGLNDQIRVLDAWLAANPPPRPTRPVPALRSSAAALGSRRVTTGLPPRAPRLGGLSGDELHEEPEISRGAGGEYMDATSAPDDATVNPPIPDFPTENPAETEGSRAGGLGGRLYRRR